jgi:ankyrin repeat protein
VEAPLIYAASRGFFKIMKYLVSHGANVNVTGRVHFLFVANSHQLNRELFVQWGGSPLTYAADGGHTDCVKYLLENGADHNHTDSVRLYLFIIHALA